MLAHKIVLVLFGHPKLTYHKHKDPELRPVTLWLHLLSKTVLAIVSLSHDPLDKPSVHTAACTAWALPSNTRQLPFDTKHLGKSVNCRKGRGKIVKHRDNIHNFCTCMFTFNKILVLSTLFTSSYYLILTKTSKPSSRRSESSSSGEVIHRTDVNFVRQTDGIQLCVPITASLSCQPSNYAETHPHTKR